MSDYNKIQSSGLICSGESLAVFDQDHDGIKVIGKFIALRLYTLSDRVHNSQV